MTEPVTLKPRKGAKPGELQVEAVVDKPVKLTRQYISREISEMFYLSLRMQKGVELFNEYRQKDLRGYMQFAQNLILRDPEDQAAGVTIVVQQYISNPTPTPGVGASPVQGDVEVVDG